MRTISPEDTHLCALIQLARVTPLYTTVIPTPTVEGHLLVDCRPWTQAKQRKRNYRKGTLTLMRMMTVINVDLQQIFVNKEWRIFVYILLHQYYSFTVRITADSMKTCCDCKKKSMNLFYRQNWFYITNFESLSVDKVFTVPMLCLTNFLTGSHMTMYTNQLVSFRCWSVIM